MLAVAAQHVLDGVAKLHVMLGSCHTRFAVLVFSTFEAAVLIVGLCMGLGPPLQVQGQDGYASLLPTMDHNQMDPLRTGEVTREACIQEVQGALNRLRMLAEVSTVADIGASTLARLLSKVSNAENGTGRPEIGIDNEAPLSQNQEGAINKLPGGGTSATEDVASWLSFNSSDLRLLDDFISMNTTPTADNITNRSSFDPPGLSLPNDFISMSAMQELKNNWQ
jgi:hypothetical protein